MLSDLGLRTRTAIVYGGIILAFFAAGYYYTAAFSIFFALIVVLGLKELLQQLYKAKYRPLKPFVYTLGLSFLALHLLFGLQAKAEAKVFPLNFQAKLNVLSALGMALIFWALLALSLALLSFFTLLLRRGPKELPSALFGIFSGIYLTLPFVTALALLYLLPYGWQWLLLAFVTPWFTDTAAYLYGRRYGKQKIFPQISPGKTWQGFWAAQISTSLLYGILALVILGGRFGRPFLLILLGLFAGFTVALADQFGDLFASALKRFFGIKDFGNLFPGHGGVLDRFDSTFFTIPVCFAWAVLLTNFIV
ncbi:MAG: phosphatidate cytidylyltransferase [Eubacteriales bacterium]|nr:phosphatidate cytidylyltransferase [Eubacteriales bacterium]